MSEEGPCQDLDAPIESPLDESQLQNIQATVEDMTAADRVRFMTSFMRFLLELAHQVGVALSADLPNGTLQNAHHDDDVTTLMQVPDSVMDKTRVLTESLHQDLETMQRHRRQKVQALRREIRATHGDNLHLTSTEEIQNLLAMLPC